MGAENSCLCKAAPECTNMAVKYKEKEKEKKPFGKDAPRAGAPLEEEDHQADAACPFAGDQKAKRIRRPEEPGLPGRQRRQRRADSAAERLLART
jgi:hypothetical protein